MLEIISKFLGISKFRNCKVRVLERDEFEIWCSLRVNPYNKTNLQSGWKKKKKKLLENILRHIEQVINQIIGQVFRR